MNIDIKTMFPKASKSFYDANPPSSPSKRKKTRSTGIGGGWEAYLAKIINHETDNSCEIPDSISQYHQTLTLDSPNARKEKSFSRARVCFTGFRVRPLDPDNYAASCKDLLDGLRHAKLISGDEWWRIEFTTRQKKVRTYAEEKTLIEIET